MDNLIFWAKTDSEGNPGISVKDHCINAGCVAKCLVSSLLQSVRDILPPGAVTLVAVHDVGKISPGFQSKCPKWLEQNKLLVKNWSLAESDHSKITQYALQEYLRSKKADQKWACALGAHHGKVHGSSLRHPNTVGNLSEDEKQAKLIAELVEIFGDISNQKVRQSYSDLWLLAGMTVVADWIASNEKFFSSKEGVPLDESGRKARQALERLNWFGGKMRSDLSCSQLFGFDANPLQKTVLEISDQPGLFIIEGPMGCGKTEAALLAAYRLIVSGQNRGFYFGLPTQITSNRIYLRIEEFLKNALSDSGTLKLAHAASWMLPNQVECVGSDFQTNNDMCLWFSGSRQSLLAHYGVGTVDQALQAMVAVKYFFLRRFGLAGKVVILDEVHSYDIYTGSLITALVKELLALKCSVIILSATLTQTRKQELLECSKPTNPIPNSKEYPLITAVQNGSVRTRTVDWNHQRTIYLTSKHFEEQEIVDECIRRAEAGQNVLYIRNTVHNAQETYKLIKGCMNEGAFEIGILHSRFPFYRRQELEAEWLERLGKHRQPSEKGSILISTQVVEQSVDIDLDFIVSDLAPSDMLLQRMGRLWRHPCTRKVDRPEFWINLPDYQEGDSAENIKNALGKSGKVYAPYVLLRSAKVFENRDQIVIPSQIREILEATYENSSAEEPSGWKDFHQELEKWKKKLQNIAGQVTLVLGNPIVRDTESCLTRWSDYDTCSLILFKNIRSVPGRKRYLEGINGETVDVLDFDKIWHHHVAKMLFQNTVKVPAYWFENQQNIPGWLSPYTDGITYYATVDAQGRCCFEGIEPGKKIFYNDSGLFLFGSIKRTLACIRR